MCWHKWESWADKETQRWMTQAEALHARLTGLSQFGDLVITQQRRCKKCNRIELREVRA